jgi:hypothetical protein
VQLVDESGAPWKPEDRIRVVAKSRLRSGAESLPVEWNKVEVDAAGRAEVSDALVALDIAGIENTVLVIEDEWLAGPLDVLASDLAAAARAGGGETVLTLPVRRRAVRGGVRILVVDAEGRPVPGVRIGVRELLGEHDDAEMSVTDEAGRATAKPSWEPLLPWWGDWHLNDDDPERPQRVVVEPGRLVRFRVTDESGAPLPETDISDTGGLFYDRTDETGCTDVALPARVRTVDLETGEWWFGRVAIPPGDAEVVLQGLSLRDVRVAVRGAAGFRGDDGLRVEWSAAEAGGPTASDGTQADRDGEGWAATLRLPPLPVRVRAYSSNLRWQARAVVAPGAEAIDLVLAPSPEQDIVLRLIDETGRPLGDRPVESDGSAFATDALLPPDARTNAEGLLVLRLPEGPHLFRRLRIGDLEVRDLRFTAPSPAPVEARLERR